MVYVYMYMVYVYGVYIKYPNWVINRTKVKMSTPKSNKNNNNNISNISRGHKTVSYNEGLSESVKNTCKKYGTQVHFKSGKSIKDELVAPKDKDHLTKRVALSIDINVIGWNVMRST